MMRQIQFPEELVQVAKDADNPLIRDCEDLVNGFLEFEGKNSKPQYGWLAMSDEVFAQKVRKLTNSKA